MGSRARQMKNAWKNFDEAVRANQDKHDKFRRTKTSKAEKKRQDAAFAAMETPRFGAFCHPNCGCGRTKNSRSRAWIAQFGE